MSGQGNADKRKMMMQEWMFSYSNTTLKEVLAVPSLGVLSWQKAKHQTEELFGLYLSGSSTPQSVSNVPITFDIKAIRRQYETRTESVMVASLEGTPFAVISSTLGNREEDNDCRIQVIDEDVYSRARIAIFTALASSPPGRHVYEPGSKLEWEAEIDPDGSLRFDDEVVLDSLGSTIFDLRKLLTATAAHPRAHAPAENMDEVMATIREAITPGLACREIGSRPPRKKFYNQPHWIAYVVTAADGDEWSIGFSWGPFEKNSDGTPSVLMESFLSCWQPQLVCWRSSKSEPVVTAGESDDIAF